MILYVHLYGHLFKFPFEFLFLPFLSSLLLSILLLSISPPYALDRLALLALFLLHFPLIRLCYCMWTRHVLKVSVEFLFS